MNRALFASNKVSATHTDCVLFLKKIKGPHTNVRAAVNNFAVPKK